MYEICDSLNLIFSTLFYHSQTHHFILMLFNGGKIYTDIPCLLIFSSKTNCTVYIKMYAYMR